MSSINNKPGTIHTQDKDTDAQYKGEYAMNTDRKLIKAWDQKVGNDENDE